MSEFVDPRATPGRPATPVSVSAVSTKDLTELHALCREGRLYDVEKWIQASRPIQTRYRKKGRRQSSALEIAIANGNHALAHLLLCNGYDPNLDSRSPLNLALETRRFDLVDLLLEWGTDPKRVELCDLFDTYKSELWERFLALGVDLTAAGGLAEALGYHTSNKPLFGFAKRHRLSDRRIQAALNIALAHHAGRGNEKGVQLCLWAGADPHAEVPSLGSEPFETDDEDADPEDRFLGFSAIDEACRAGEVAILERLGPDPCRDDFDQLYRMATTESVVMVLAQLQPPSDVASIVRSHLAWLTLGRSPTLYVLGRLFALGMRWTEATQAEIRNIRRILGKVSARHYVEAIKLLALDDHWAAQIFSELCRTPGMRARFVEVGFLPGRTLAHERPTRFREVLARAGIELPKPTRRVYSTVSIGRWSLRARHVRLTRQQLFELVWSQPVERLAKSWGLSGRGLSKACERLQIPLPPRGFWAKVQSGQRLGRPSLPAMQPGEAEQIVIRAPESPESTG